MCTYVVHIIRNMHVRVMEAENSITLTTYTSEHVFIALGWRSEMIMGFHEYTYQECEYIIKPMHAQCTCLYDCTVIPSTFVIKLLRQC